MTAGLLLSPIVTVPAGIVLVHVVWWLAGDFLLEHVGIPFLDRGAAREPERREPAAAPHAAASRRAMHARRPSERRQAISRPPTYERDKRSTGMSRGVRA